jgi:hypothetical protein
MVETSQSPQTTVTAVPAAAPPATLGRKPKPVVMVANEPLQMVETQSKD